MSENLVFFTKTLEFFLLKKSFKNLKAFLLPISSRKSSIKSFETSQKDQENTQIAQLPGLKPSHFSRKGPIFELKTQPLFDFFSRKISSKIYNKFEIGDIFYLKLLLKKPIKDLKNSISRSNEPKKIPGVLIADSNSLLLALKVSQFHQKNSYKSFRKALFQIESESIRNIGLSVAYGDEIHFRHLYSNKFVAFKPKEPNKYAGLDLYLEETVNKNAKFRIIPGNKSKDLRDAIGFYEKILIGNPKKTRFWQIPLEESNERMEVFGMDNGSVFKLCPYIKAQEYHNFEDLKGKKLRNGDILMLKNRENQGLLSVGDWNLRKSLIEKKIKISNADDKFNTIQPLFVINQLNSAKILDCYHEIDTFLQISPTNFNHFWEIQCPKVFQSKIFSYNDRFLLRNIATGLYLSLNKNTGKLILSSFLQETNDTISEFFFEGINAEELEFRRNVKLFSSYKHWILAIKDKKIDNIMNIQFETKKSGEIWRYSFELCQISQEIDIEGLENLTTLFNTLLDFHLFLQNFGMIEQENDQKNTNEFLLKYDYDQALLQENALQLEIKRFETAILTLFEFLHPKNLEIYKERQLLLKEMKIFELLILLAKLIDILIYANKNTKEHRAKAVKCQDSQGFSFRFSEKSAFFIAKKHLEPSIRSIFSLLGLLIKENAITSSVLLENGEFLTNQLSVFPQEVSSLIRNALRSVSQEILEENVTILDWLSSLESLNEISHNIEDQTELIEILATSLLDNQENSVRINQQRIQLELFSHRGGSEMKRGLLRFAFLNEKPVIIFKKDVNLKEFITNNPSLSTLTIARIKENEDFSAFYVEDLIEKANFLVHIRYISSVLKLIALLIKDRNMKVISKVNSLGISSQHILFCLKTANFPLKLKSSYFLLYQNLYLDREPFVPISKYHNRCVLWSNIKDFDLLNPTYYLLNLEDLQNPEGGKVFNQFYLDIEGIIKEFWTERGFLDSWALNLGAENTIIDKIEFIYVILQVTRGIIDLGYTTYDFNQKVFRLLAKMYEIFISETVVSGFWLGEILKEAWVFGENNKEKEDILAKIFFESTKLLKVYFQVLEIVQINIFMKIFRENFEDFTQKPAFEDLFALSLKHQPLVKSSQIPPKTGSTSRVLDSKTLRLNEKESQSPLKISPESIKTSQLGTSIWLFLLGTRRYQPKILKGVMEVLERYFSLREGLFEQLKLIELIDGRKEEELYKELDGTPILFGQVISPKKLEFQIEKVLNEYDERIKGAKDINQRESKIRELNNVINKLLVKFKETLALEKGLFTQMQNIIRNLQVHKYIFRLLSMQSNKKAQEEIELFQITIEFFQLFCQDNNSNQIWVLSHIRAFLELLLNKIAINKLLRAALALKKGFHELISPYIDLLFWFIKQNFPKNQAKKQPGNPFKFLAYESLLTLKALLYDSKTGLIYLENQKKVLNSLLKHDFLLKFSKTIHYIETRNKLLDKVKGLDSLKNPKSFPLHYHLILIELLSHLAVDFKLGVLQLQKLLIYEQLKTLIYDPITPFLYKKPYIRVLFSVYFVQYDEENSSISIEDFKAFLIQILKDLNSSFSFLEFVIKPRKNGLLTNEQKIARQEIFTNKGVYMDNPEEKERQTVHSKKIMEKTGAISSLNEQKKILFDGSEYWKFFYGGSRSFNRRKDGLIMVLLDCLSEIERRNLVEKVEFNDIFEKIKRALSRIKTCLGKIEKYFSINLTKLHLIIHETLRKIPHKNNRKSNQGINSKKITGSEYRGEDMGKSQEICQEFLEKINEILMKKNVNIVELSSFYGVSAEKFVTKEEFVEKTREILRGFGEEFEINKEEISNFVENFMMFKKNPREMNLKRFIKKLEKIVEKKRAIYQREGLKHEKQTMIKLEERELSLQKKASLVNLIQWYQKDCILKENDYEIGSMIRRFIEKIEKENCESLKGFIVRLLEVFKSYGQISHLLKVLEIFTSEILRKGVEETEHLRNCLWETGMIRRVLQVLKKREKLEHVDRALQILLNCLLLGQKNVIFLLMKSFKGFFFIFFNFFQF